ncbi:hypothetical protein SUGI_0803190 [Cryptomeria japonica]|uniref:uncharacterized protein LOC131031187 n=1 Tax=Cryptomeria japonica TaxID=3369 RepID=UPI002414A8C4|nr:uncharacterized protein LOC131031187 [Cryptomeria japonica]GLJ39337.1 hypothetical protein SUGI_0803190 [Cryptomeria japonica]
MVHSVTPFPLPRYGIAHGIAQLNMTNEESADPNQGNVFSYYAYVQKSTGLATNPSPENPAIETYGPYLSPAATATVYDLSLILHSNRYFVGNFRPLARCVLAIIQRETAKGLPADLPLLIAYGSCLVDALATYIGLNEIEMSRLWSFIENTFFMMGQSFQNDFNEHGQKHLELLSCLRNQVLEAYVEQTWPDDVWPEFRSWVRGENIVSSGLRPPCFQVLIGAKAIEEQENVALPDKQLVEFKSSYAANLCAMVEDQLGKLRVPGIFTKHGFFIKMIVFVLHRHFDKRDLDIKPSHRPLLFARYAGHIADALRNSILYNGYFQIREKSYPIVLQYSSDVYIDGLCGSPRAFAMVDALDEIVEAYNSRQWPVDVWCTLLDDINNSNPNFGSKPNFESGSLVNMYENSCGGNRTLCTDVQMLMPEIESWTSEEDEVYEASGGEEIEDYEEEENLNDCYQKTKQCFNCLGPSSVSYTFRWLCQSDHTVEGLREETFGPFSVMSGDCASRIHDEVKKIFPFATAFQSVRRDPFSRAPNFVVGACLHYKNPQVVPMEYRDGQWFPTGQGIPMDLNGEEGDGGI